ncbi:hypothetical protein J4434_09005 [Candidatus Woesearchaeota archaeon]|nr:hypothetical protein [Candidatus Woesearchaeota archaeon]
MKINKTVLIGAIIGALYGAIGWILVYFPIISIFFLPSHATFHLIALKIIALITKSVSDTNPIIRTGFEILINIIIWTVIGTCSSLIFDRTRKNRRRLVYSVIIVFIFLLLISLLIMLLTWLSDYLGIGGI